MQNSVQKSAQFDFLLHLAILAQFKIRYADEFDICMGLFSGHENTSGGAAPNCFLDRIAATDAARNAFVAEWSQAAEKKELVFIRWGAFLTDPPEGKKLTGTILDAVSRMLATYTDLKGDATYPKWKSFLENFTDD